MKNKLLNSALLLLVALFLTVLALHVRVGAPQPGCCGGCIAKKSI